MLHSRIAIEGNIGAGKTSLVRKLAADFGALAVEETFSDNPFLPLFYRNPARYALPLELSFLAERFQQLRATYSKPELFSHGILSDYTFHKSLLFARVNLSQAEFELYQRIFRLMDGQIPLPDLIVFLYAPVEHLLANISRRGRSYERAITADYLQRLNEAYMSFFRQSLDQRVLILDTSKLDFVQDDAAYYLVKAAVTTEYAPGVHYEVID